MNTLRRLVCLLVLAPILAACETTSIFHGNPDEASPSAGDFTESPSPLVGSEFDALWDRTEHVLGMEGYGVDRDRTSYAEHRMVTHWDTLLAPTRFEGKRNRAWVQFRQAKPGAWIVGVAVQVQRNADIDMPSAESQAQWEDTAGNAARAGVILWKIESGLRAEGETK